MSHDHYLIPAQHQGLEKNLAYTFVCDSVEEAEDCFVDAKERLLDVNSWNKYSQINDIEFRLQDAHGREAHRHARRGDHIRLAAATLSVGRVEEFDWVAIEAIEYDDYPDQGMETFGMRLHPCATPAGNLGPNAPYSLTDNATSTLVIQRRGRKLSATYHGRNEPIQATTGSPADDHCWLGLSELQWANLVTGIGETNMVRR